MEANSESYVPSDEIDFRYGFMVETTAGLTGFVTCTICGALTTGDPGSFIHLRWHQQHAGNVQTKLK